jgi:mRNA interferase HicA
LLAYPYRGTLPEVKRQELEAALRALGWYFFKHGGKHDLWAHPKKQRKLVVPRHKEINEHLARSILRQAAAGE